MTEVDTRVRGLSGGQKEMWLRQHRSEVLHYLHQWGPDECRQRFNMRTRTFANFIDGDSREKENLTKSDRAVMIARVAREDVADLRTEVRGLREDLDLIKPVCGVLYELGHAVARLSQLHSDRLLADYEGSRENEAKG